MEDRSCILIIDDANKVVANKVVARMFGDGPTAQNLSVPLAATSAGPATHWCNHIWRTESAAADLLALPTGTSFTDGLAWSDYGTTAAAAAAAVVAPHLTVYVATGGVPTEHLAGVLAGRGLVQVAQGGGA
jgi:hypothetical protein